MSTRRLLPIAPGILGAFALCLLAGCREEAPGAAWDGPSVEEEAAAGEPVASASPAGTGAPETAGGVAGTGDGDPGPAGGLRFLSYNLKNWLTMERYERGKTTGERPKPERERDALVGIVAGARPDILGICEIGSREDLGQLQQQLAAAGVELPNVHHGGGADTVRHLALLTRFPIIERTTHEDLGFQLEGRQWTVQRGILDVTVDTPSGPLRCLGVHLKSKREIPEADQAMIRLNEARQLRKVVDGILAEDPGVRLVVYGDFNDTRQAAPLRTVQGSRGSGNRLNMVRLTDSRGEYWTHHWSYQDVYSRFDYKLVTTNLLDAIVNDESGVLDPDDWAVASDHRALLLTLDL